MALKDINKPLKDALYEAVHRAFRVAIHDPNWYGAAGDRFEDELFTICTEYMDDNPIAHGDMDAVFEVQCDVIGRAFEAFKRVLTGEK
jgi:hypothetical protein